MWTDATEWRFILRKEGIVTGSTTWTDLEDIMLNEISQVPKGGGCVISLTCGIKKSHLTVTENRMGGGRGLGGHWSNSTNSSLCQGLRTWSRPAGGGHGKADR